MIRKDDLDAAIAECIGAKDPNANTCIKLASYYTIKNELYGKNTESDGIEMPRSYSYDAPPEIRDDIVISSNTEFADAINGKSQADVWEVIEELIEAVHCLHPRMYRAFIANLQDS